MAASFNKKYTYITVVSCNQTCGVTPRDYPFVSVMPRILFGFPLASNPSIMTIIYMIQETFSFRCFGRIVLHVIVLDHYQSAK